MNIADMIKAIEPEIRKALPAVMTPEEDGGFSVFFPEETITAPLPVTVVVADNGL